MDSAPYAILLCISSLGLGQPAASSSRSLLDAAANASRASSASSSKPTRISPLPRGAPIWRRSEVVPSPSEEHQEVAVTTSLGKRAVWVGAPDGSEAGAGAGAECRTGPTSKSRTSPRRRVRGRTLTSRREHADEEEDESYGNQGAPPVFDYKTPIHKPLSYDLYSSILSSGTRRHPFLPPDSGQDDEPDAPGSSGELVLDAVYAGDVHKHDGYNMKPAKEDGRGRPVVVRGPGFNSVAIGFLVYLILLSVLQNSIFNISRNGLLGLGLGPLRDRERRDMEVAAMSEAMPTSAQQRLGLVQDPREDLPHPFHPVLVAAVLDSDPDLQVLGGPR